MSLLMKALEKASKERKEGDPERDPEPAPGAPALPSGDSVDRLTLEPLYPKAPDTPLPRAAPARDMAPEPPRDSAHAATVIRAGRRDSGGAIAYVQAHLILVVGVLAGIFAAIYGTYIYLQIAHPGIFTRQVAAAPAAKPFTPVTPAPASVASSQTGTAAGDIVPVPATSLLPPLQASEPREPAARTGTTAPAAATAAAAFVPAAPAPVPRDSIKVTPGGATGVNPTLAAAYRALDEGDLGTAQTLYGQMQKNDPANVDVWLGLAATASRMGNGDAAVKYYMQALEVDPGNAAAQAGLITLVGGADPAAAESRLKQLIAREPSPALYAALGNIYADQNRWPEAQQAYFEAHRLQSDNADYAYNLAIGLEHIGQPKLALGFYRRALALAATQGRSAFSTAAAQERIAKLERVTE